jgi:hypothetical protein
MSPTQANRDLLGWVNALLAPGRAVPGRPGAGTPRGGAPSVTTAPRKSALVIEPLTCIFATNEG